VRAGQVLDTQERVRSAEAGVLDSAADPQVHRHAREKSVGGPGGVQERLVACRVITVTADELVVALAAVQDVVANAALQDVIALPADQMVVARPALEDVGLAAAVDRVVGAGARDEIALLGAGDGDGDVGTVGEGQTAAVEALAKELKVDVAGPADFDDGMVAEKTGVGDQNSGKNGCLLRIVGAECNQFVQIQSFDAVTEIPDKATIPRTASVSTPSPPSIRPPL
jgi:hypothetical protein